MLIGLIIAIIFIIYQATVIFKLEKDIQEYDEKLNAAIKERRW